MAERRLTPVNLDDYKPLRDVVFESMRDAIIAQVLRPGERLMEVQLAEEMGVSRTPVREAIRKLELEGFAIIVPRKGAYVASISVSDVHELYEIRVALETLACGLAAERATFEEIEAMEKALFGENSFLGSSNVFDTVKVDVGLHDMICRASRNERLQTTLNNLREQIYRTRAVVASMPGIKKRSLEQHRRIVEAIASRDSELARALMQEHVENAEESMITYLKGLNKPEL